MKTTAGSNPFKTRALYVWSDNPSQHGFWKACGINMLQLCDLGWHRNENTVMEAYYDSMAEQIASARRAGFEVNVILFANIRQWRGPEDLEPSGIGVKFHPGDSAAMQDRLRCLSHAVTRLREADGFTFFAGDPGGVPAELGAAKASDWLDMAEQVGGVVKRCAPHAYFNLNPWAVTMWQYPELRCEDVRWWIRESELTRGIAQSDFAQRGWGIELAGHNYYRAMALRLYDQAGATPERFPSPQDVGALTGRGVQRVWAWPYFLLDEADDGDVGPDGALREMCQSETRYIRRFVDNARQMGVNGIVGNWSYIGHKAKAMNTYAFGRFTTDPDAQPQDILREYAQNLAEQDSVKPLEEIFKFIENQSNWQKKLPPSERMADYETAVAGADRGLELLEQVRPLEVPRDFPIPESPAEYLQKVRERLLWIKKGKQ